MSTEENKALDRRFIDEAWNRGNMAIIDELVAATTWRCTCTWSSRLAPSFALSTKEARNLGAWRGRCYH